MDRADARAELWRRYDAGTVSAEEVEARLLLLERVDDDHTSLRRAIDAPIPLRRRTSLRRAALLVSVSIGAVGVAGAAIAVLGDSRGDGALDAGGGRGFATTMVLGDGRGVVVDVGVGVAAGPAADCEVARVEAPASDESPANPTLLSDPPFVPEGYSLAYDEDLTPGFDNDVAMSTAAGNPSPTEIRARGLDGALPVRMRLFRFEDADQARASGASVQASACSFGATLFDTGTNEIVGTMVSGPIPTTAFASWQVGERRFIVAVETAGDDPTAQALAVEIATAELESTRTN